MEENQVTNNQNGNTQASEIKMLDNGSIQFGDGKILSTEDYLCYLLNLMIQYGSSDIYFTYNEEPALRICGEIYRLTNLPKLTDLILEKFSDILMEPEDVETYNKNLSSDIGYSVHGRRYRVNVSRQRDHKMIVIRLLEEKVPTIDSRGLPQIFKTLTKKTNGLIFVAGPTGSGKSTTLAAMIEEINLSRSCHVITIEDPIEYVFEPKKAVFEQKQLGKDVISFASAMKYALRQRPDVILLGESRDPESLKNAIALAETGHLVLTTIHSRSAEQTLNKIISMFPAEEQPAIKNEIAENMTAIIVQKLMKKADGKGMVPAHEILMNNTAVENTIRENKLNQLKNTIYSNRNVGMQMLEDDLARLVNEGQITEEEALFNANDRDNLARTLKEQKAKLQTIG